MQSEKRLWHGPGVESKVNNWKMSSAWSQMKNFAKIRNKNLGFQHPTAKLCLYSPEILTSYTLRISSERQNHPYKWWLTMYNCNEGFKAPKWISSPFAIHTWVLFFIIVKPPLFISILSDDWLADWLTEDWLPSWRFLLLLLMQWKCIYWTKSLHN